VAPCLGHSQGPVIDFIEEFGIVPGQTVEDGSRIISQLEKMSIKKRGIF
jgi:hypothetical protein